MNSLSEIYTLNLNSDRFNDAIGTYGLNYIILEAKLKIYKIQSTRLVVTTKKFYNFTEMINLFNQNIQSMFNIKY